jgi:hypothetical protein
MDSLPVPLAASPLRRNAVAIVVFLFCLFLLCSTESDYGITWDEAETNFPAARRQVEWFRLLLQGHDVVNEEAVRAYYETESDHPSLPRTLMAVSRLLLPGSIQDRTAFAFPTNLLVSLFIAWLFAVLWKRSNFYLALYGAIVLFFHPHWFGHAHFAEYDILVAMAWFVTAFSFLSAMEGPEISHTSAIRYWFRVVIATVTLGLAFSIKVHAFFLPFPLLLWAVLFRRWRVWQWCFLSALIVPLVYVATQPYLWWHTVERITHRFQDYGSKVPIHVFYFGHLYPGEVPWHYSWVMLLVTSPVGIAIPYVVWALIHCCGPRESVQIQHSSSSAWWLFLLLNALALPLVFTFKSSYDGLRFFLSSLPFLVLLSVTVIEKAKIQLSHLINQSNSRRWVSSVCVILAATQVYTCWRIHPFDLSYYSFLVGGVRGASSIGFETTYWCDSMTPDFIRALAGKIPVNARVATHAMDAPPLIEYQKMGIAPPGWRFDKEGPVDCRILQFRQGFFGPMEYRIFSERVPIVEAEVDGIPLTCAYSGP